MSTLQGLVDYPGLNGQFTKAEYTLSTGISPGKVTIEMPQEIVANLAATGDVTFSCGDDSFTLPDCVLENEHTEQSPGGYIARVFISDRRYWWSRTGYISGHYNLRMPSGSNANEGFNSQATAVDGDTSKIRPGTEKKPQEMAILCLQAMGEDDYDVSALPNNARPEIDWSYQNPAEALQQLCDKLGCRVTYVVDTDSVTIVAIGQGADLPDNGQQTFISSGAQPPQMPSALTLVGGPTIYQGYLPLEAVGVDTNGQVLPIGQLSYRPSGGWGTTSDQFGGITDPKVLPLLAKLYRMWRVDLPIYVPGTNAPEVTDIRQIKLYDRLLDTWADPNDPAKQIPKKPELWGNFDTQHSQVKKTQTGQPEPYRAMTVDEDRWLIYTEDRLWVVNDQQEYEPACLAVKICYSVRDPDTWEPVRYTRTRELDSQNDTPERPIHHEDIFVKVYGSYREWNSTSSTADGNSVTTAELDLIPPGGPLGTTDNIQSDSLDQEADYYLDAAESEYIEQDSLDVPYAGIVPIQVDGLIHQVTYTIECPNESGSGGKTMTRASLATEHNPYVLPWAARRKIEQRQSLDKFLNHTKVGRDVRSFLEDAGF
jgi:hypothetical protein